MSGYKTEDGTDLDDIFYINNSDANINDDFLIEGKTGTGRYLTRVNSTSNSENNLGFITSGDQDLNELYVRRDEIVDKEIILLSQKTRSSQKWYSDIYRCLFISKC